MTYISAHLRKSFFVKQNQFWKVNITEILKNKSAISKNSTRNIMNILSNNISILALQANE